MKNYYISLELDNYYHIYNHAVGQDVLFKKKENYNFFLKKYSEYINPIADTFAYCLMPNHFHFAVKIKDEKVIRTKLQDFTKIRDFGRLELMKVYEKYISKQFSNLFSSYTQSFNRQQNRKGTLFMKPFKRIRIKNEIYLKNAIHYIHYNPVYHGFVDNSGDWKFSSYNSFFTKKETKLKRKEVIELFGDLDNFYFVHKKETDDNIFDE